MYIKLVCPKSIAVIAVISGLTWKRGERVNSTLVVTRMDTPENGETLEVVYIKYQPILVKSYQRFTKFNYGVTKTIYES